MLSPDLLKKVQKVYIASKYRANDVFSGEYVSAFKGRGMEFEEVREYQPGDDVRNIDWNVTARMENPFVKVFREEREQTVMLLIDGSGSCDLGTKARTKRELIAEMSAVIAFAAIKSNDKVGLLIFTDTVEKFIPPKKGRAHVWKVISEILSFKPTRKKTDLAMALTTLNKVVSRRAVSFIVSDFLSPDFKTTLKISSAKHDLVLLQVLDPIEKGIAGGGLMVFEDLETGEKVTVDLSALKRQREFGIELNKKTSLLIDDFKKMGLDHLVLQTDVDYIDPLLKLFRKREKRQ